MENSRVTEIANPHCSQAQDQIKGGTGYLVGEDLILTARHILTDTDDDIPLELARSYHVRLWGDFERGKPHEWLLNSATLCWESQRFDLALLRFDHSRPDFLTGNMSTTQFGLLGDEELSAKGLGFPKVQKIGNAQNPEPLKGDLSDLAGRKTDQVRLRVTSLVPNQPEKWAGISGTALFVDDYLVGVVTDTNQGFGERALWAVPIALVVEEDEEFCRLVFGAGKEPVLQSLPVTDSQSKTNSDFVVSDPSFSTYDPKTFTGREALISDLLVKLRGQTRLVWITGMSGIGKTTLGECVASQAWESDRSFQWVYLEILEGQSPDFGSVAAELLGKMGDIDLDPQLRNNPEQIAQRLIQRLKSSPYWIQLDSLERLLNPDQPTEFGDACWKTFFERCLTESDLGSRLVLTSQVFPIGLGEFADRYPKTWAEYRLAGLETGVQQREFFAKRGVESSHRDILTRIAQTYEGHPLVLKVMAEEILQEFGGDVLEFWREYQREFEQVARELSGGGLAETEYNEALDRKVRERLKKSLVRLPQDALDLLCRSAVFRRPVPKKFWLGMMGDRTAQQQKAAYEVLGDHALIEKEGRAIRQHNLIRDLAYNLLKADPDAWQAAERQAAHLWLTVYQPTADDSNLEKVRGYLEAIDHYCEVNDWEQASKLYTIQIEPNQILLYLQLLNWAYYKELRQVSQRLVDHVVDQTKVTCLNQIGNAYRNSGDAQSSIDYHLQALKLSDELKDLHGKARTLVNLGLTYTNLGNYKQAIIFLEQSLVIKQEAFIHEPQKRRREECFTLGHLGNAYYGLGNYEEAINFHNQHLAMTQDISVREASPQQSRISEGRALCRIGNAYKKLEQYQQAVSFYQESLFINDEMKDRRGKGITLVNMGETQMKLEQYSESLTNNQAAFSNSKFKR